MLALVLEGTARVVRDAPKPVRKPGDARISMRLAGVCDTDLQLAKGYMGYQGVLGHEFVGTVMDADNSGWVGKRVVADINAGCGECPDCLERDGHHCTKRTVLGIVGRHGAIAEELVMPESCLVEVPESVPDEAAVFAEPLAAALHLLDVATPSDRAIVLGDGKLGLLCAMALAGADIATTLVGHHPDKLALADGVDTLLETELSRDFSGSLIVEATGTATGLALALRLCEPRGKVVLKSTIADMHQIDLSPIVINELVLVGSRCGDLRLAVQSIAEGSIDPRPLIAARYSLAQADQALEHAGRKGVLKVLVDNRQPCE